MSVPSRFERRAIWCIGSVVALVLVTCVTLIVTRASPDPGPETDAAYCARRCAREGGVAMGWETGGRYAVPRCRCEYRTSDGGAP